jgi:ABC-type glycerol-3-phosphate transport system permease component
LRPVSAVTLMLGLVYTLKVFDIIWIMTRGGPVDSSTTFATWSYQLGFGNRLPEFGICHYIGNNDQQWNAIMATAVTASIPATVLLVLAQRYVAAGITTGSVKD